MRSRFNNIKLLIFLILVLVVPYSLRIIDYRLEMFPSIVLPFGSGKAKIKDTTRLHINAIYGYTPKGELKVLDKAEFLQNIRVGYFDFLYEARFGLRESSGHTFKTNRFGIPVSLKTKISAKDKELTKSWIRERLLEQGLVDSVLLLKKKQVIIPRNGNFYEEKVLIHDTILDLY